MSRPYDWHPLAGSDPIPGDPQQAASLSRTLRDTAEAIRNQVASIRGFATDDFWDSDAGNAFRGHASETVDRLGKAFDRYDAAAEALDNFIPELDAAQQQSVQALTIAQQAQSDLSRANNTLSWAPKKLPTHAPAGRPATKPNPAYYAALTQRANANAALKTAEQMLQNAINAVHDAARSAAAIVQTAMDSDGLTDGWSEKAWHGIKTIADWASNISTVLGAVALVLAFIPGIGDALAAVVGSLALIAGVVGLVGHLAEAIHGGGSWLDVGLDVIGVVSFGVGRVLGKSAVEAAKVAIAGGKLERAGEIMGGLKASEAKGAEKVLASQAWKQAGKDFSQVTKNFWGPTQREASKLVKQGPKPIWPGAEKFLKEYGHKSVLEPFSSSGWKAANFEQRELKAAGHLASRYRSALSFRLILQHTNDLVSNGLSVGSTAIQHHVLRPLEVDTLTPIGML